MSRKGTLFVGFAAAAMLGVGIGLAQDRGHDANKDTKDPLKQDKPLIATGGSTDLKSQCESALKTKTYLKDLKITFRDAGGGRVVCEGTVPSKVEACALFLTCMSIHGVGAVDCSGLRIEHWGSETTLPAKEPANGVPASPRDRLGTDVQGGLKTGEKDLKPTDKMAEKPALGSKKLSMYAVIINPEEKGVTTTPAGARTFENDVIVIGDVPATALPQKGLENRTFQKGPEFPSPNPGNSVPNQNDQLTPGQPVAPHNPGAYPNSDPGSNDRDRIHKD